MKTYFEQLIDYNYWANGLIMKYAEKLSARQFIQPFSEILGSPREILAHILLAEQYWFERMQANQIDLDELSDQIDFKDLSTIEDLYSAWFDLELQMRQFLADLEEEKLIQTFSFTCANEEPREYRPMDILTQMVLHGGQHRAELALILTELGHSPGDIDYTRYLHP